jgi:hypothetical protein
MFENVINFIQETYKTKEFIPSHGPKFIDNEKKYLNECIDSTFVSSVGKFYAQCGDLTNSEWLEDLGVNIPSSVIL